jgi:nucleotide-binding universal stress UspA family protein
MYDTILVPTDGSDCANEAVDHALDLAARLDAHVEFLSVVDTRNLGLTTPSDVDVDALEAEYRETSEAAVAAAGAAAEAAGVPATTTIEIGLPHSTIVEYAADPDVDLVVIGTHGRTGLQHVLLGSVAERVVRLADVPVLTVHA